MLVKMPLAKAQNKISPKEYSSQKLITAKIEAVTAMPI